MNKPELPVSLDLNVFTGTEFNWKCKMAHRLNALLDHAKWMEEHQHWQRAADNMQDGARTSQPKSPREDKPQEPKKDEQLRQIIRNMISEVGCRAGHTTGETKEHMEGLHKIFNEMFYGKPKPREPKKSCGTCGNLMRVLPAVCCHSIELCCTQSYAWWKPKD